MVNQIDTHGHPNRPSLIRGPFSDLAPSGHVVLIGVLIGLAVIVSSASLLIGASALYVLLQLIALLGIVALIALAKDVPCFVAFVVIGSLAKNFAISQIVKVLFWQRADLNVLAPLETAAIVATGTMACVAVFIAYISMNRRLKLKDRPDALASLPMIGMVGWAMLAIGFSSKIIALIGISDSVVFYYLGDLAYAGCAAFALQLWRKTSGKRLFDIRQLISLGALVLIGTLTISKGVILTPFLYVFAICIWFRFVPKVSVLVAAALLCTISAAVIHPIVNFSRASGGSDFGSVAAVLGGVLADPSRMSAISAASDSIESGWSSRLYFGKPMGIIGRFTPNQIGEVAIIKPYSALSLKSYLADSFSGLMPTTLGYERRNVGSNSELQSAVQRKSVAGFNSSNYGLLATFYLYGGLGGVAIGISLFVSALFGGYMIIFGQNYNSIWSVPMAIVSIFAIADQGLSGNIILFIHGAFIQGAAIMLSLFILNAFVTASMPVRHSSR